MHANKISHWALIGFSCFAPLIFHFLAFFSVSHGRCYLFVGLLLGKRGVGERSFFLSEQLTAELTWLTMESWWRANRKECKDYPLRVLWNNELLPEGTGTSIPSWPGEGDSTGTAHAALKTNELIKLKTISPQGKEEKIRPSNGE